MTTSSEYKYIEENRFIDDIEPNKQKQITSNVNQYQESIKMDEENKRKRKWSTQSVPQKYHQNNVSSHKSLTYKFRNDNKNGHYVRSKTYNYSKSKELLQERKIKNEDYVKNKIHNLENSNINNVKHKDMINDELQKNKTAISLINEWAMRGDGSSEKKTFTVFYTLVAITGHAHKPIFTYMCQVHDKTAKGDGHSKKEAKQNAAAQMWEILSKVNSTTNNDKVITSTTITDNFEANENDTTNCTSTEGSQVLDKTDSNIDDEEMQHSNYDPVKIAHCNMNPVGALQELSTAYRWTPPFYNFQKLGSLNNEQQLYGVHKTVSYEFTCKVFHLQTTGTASTKKEAKRLAARLMFDLINDIGAEKLNTLKSLESKIMDYKMDCKLEPEEIEEQPLELNSAQYFRSYFTSAVAEAFNNTEELYFPFESDITQKKEEIKRKHTIELEQSILQFNSNLSAVDQLQTLSQQLNFQVTYIHVNDMDVQQQKSQDGEFSVLVQVTTVPIIVATGHSTSLSGATEAAASSVLLLFKNMLICTQNRINEEQGKVPWPIIL